MSETRNRFSWLDGWTTEKTLSRSFGTLAEAEAFSRGKNVVDIYRTLGKFKVEWLKTIDNNSEVRKEVTA